VPLGRQGPELGENGMSTVAWKEEAVAVARDEREKGEERKKGERRKKCSHCLKFPSVALIGLA
jgi:hypothetical protein